MKWYLDLDDTLYRTTFGYGKVVRTAAELYKIRPLLFALRLLKTRRKFDFGDGVRHSTQLFHALRSYGIDSIEAEALLLKKLKGIDFLYPDAAKFLDWLEKQKIKPTIITLGDPETQDFKISLIPRLRNFDRIVVQEPKEDYLSRLPKHEAIIIDDRQVNNLPKWCKGVMVTRKRTAENYDGKVIKSLTELIDES